VSSLSCAEIGRGLKRGAGCLSNLDPGQNAPSWCIQGTAHRTHTTIRSAFGKSIELCMWHRSMNCAVGAILLFKFESLFSSCIHCTYMCKVILRASCKFSLRASSHTYTHRHIHTRTHAHEHEHVHTVCGSGHGWSAKALKPPKEP